MKEEKLMEIYSLSFFFKECKKLFAFCYKGKKEYVFCFHYFPSFFEMMKKRTFAYALIFSFNLFIKKN